MKMLRSLFPIRQLLNFHIRNISSSATKIKPVDSVHEGLKSAKQLDHVWQLVQANEKVLNETHVIATLKVLKKILIHPSPDCTDKDRHELLMLVKNVHFERLCNHTLKIMRTMSPVNLCQLLSLLQHLAVPVETVIFKSLLYSIKNRMNEFTITEIVKMDLVLSNLQKTHEERNRPNQLMTVIRMAFPVLIEIKVQFKEIPYEDVDTMVKVLRYSCDNRLKSSVINHLTESINSRRDTLNPYQCFTILLSLTKAHRRNEKDFDTTLAGNLSEYCMHILAQSDYDRCEVDIRRIFERSPKLLAVHGPYFSRAVSLYKNLFLTLDIETMERVLKTLELNNQVDQELVDLYERRVKSVANSSVENSV